MHIFIDIYNTYVYVLFSTVIVAFMWKIWYNDFDCGKVFFFFFFSHSRRMKTILKTDFISYKSKG